MVILAHSGAGMLGLRDVLVEWQTGVLPSLGAAVELSALAAYVLAASRPSPRGRRWPRRRTASFAIAIGLMMLVLQSGLAAYDERTWVHVVQHLVLMMVVPPLLAYSSPMTLLLRTLPSRRRRHVTRTLGSGGVRAAVDSSFTRWSLPVEYHGTMALFFLTGWQAFSDRHPALHELTHAYFMTCGLVFWWPLVGADPARWRPSYRAKLFLVAVGVPVDAALGLVLALAAHQDAGLILALGGIAATALGLGLIVSQHATNPRSLSWQPLSMKPLHASSSTSAECGPRPSTAV